jgi:hypothetical protein
MRFSTKQHQASCGLAPQARRRSMCLLRQDGALWLQRHMNTSPELFLQAMAPSRAELVVCVEGLGTWSWLAALCARAGMPVVLGHARALPAIHGGQAKNETIDALTSAARRRGGRLPPASVSPAVRRATRALLRRRTPVRRPRAEWLLHRQQPPRP